MTNPRFTEIQAKHVEDAAGAAVPGRIQKWSCIVSVRGVRTEFPVKQLWLNAAARVHSPSPQATPADCTSHTAVAGLKRLGFEVKYYG